MAKIEIEQILVSPYGTKVLALGKDKKVYRWDTGEGAWILHVLTKMNADNVAKSLYQKVVGADMPDQKTLEKWTAGLKSLGLLK